MDAKPRELRASKKLWGLGAVFNVMMAAGGAVTAMVVSSVGVGSVEDGAFGSAASVLAGAEAEVETGAVAATAVGAAAEIGTGAEAEANSRSSEAEADGPKNANNMAQAMANFTRAPPLARYP
jgi:hypothetical protein